MVYDFPKIHKQCIHLGGFSLHPSFLSYLFSLSLPDLPTPKRTRSWRDIEDNSSFVRHLPFLTDPLLFLQDICQIRYARKCAKTVAFFKDLWYTCS